MPDLSKYEFAQNPIPDVLDADQVSILSKTIVHAVAHFLPHEVATIRRTILHIDEAAKGAKYRLNVLVETDTEKHLITLFGSVKYIALKLRDIEGGAKKPDEVWFYDRSKLIGSERAAFSDIDAQIRTSRNGSGHPNYANFASGQIAKVSAGIWPVRSSLVADQGFSDCPIPLVATPGAEEAWAGDW